MYLDKLKIDLPKHIKALEKFKNDNEAETLLRRNRDGRNKYYYDTLMRNRDIQKQIDINKNLARLLGLSC